MELTKKRTPYWRTGSRQSADKKTTGEIKCYQFPDELTAAQRLIFMILALNANKNGMVSIRRSEVSIATGLSEVTVVNSLAELVRTGMIGLVGKNRAVATYAIRVGLEGKPSPRKPEASFSKEEMLVGAMLVMSEDEDWLSARKSILRMLKTSDFENPACRAIFNKITQLPISYSITDVLDALREIGALDKVGGVAYFSRLVDAIPSIFQPLELASCVYEDAVRRAMRGKN